jgi:hypothetical protein
VDHGQKNWRSALAMCNLYSITTNQAAVVALFRVVADSGIRLASEQTAFTVVPTIGRHSFTDPLASVCLQQSLTRLRVVAR